MTVAPARSTRPDLTASLEQLEHAKRASVAEVNAIQQVLECSRDQCLGEHLERLDLDLRGSVGAPQHGSQPRRGDRDARNEQTDYEGDDSGDAFLLNPLVRTVFVQANSTKLLAHVSELAGVRGTPAPRRPSSG